MKLPYPIILASKSPRRHELMKLMGFEFKVELKDVDESYPEGLSPAEIAVYVSEKKAKAFGDVEGQILITSDTIVALDGKILGKPVDRDDAVRMLNELAGRSHEVYTGVTVVKDNMVHSFFDRTEVHCRAVSEAEVNYYIDHFKPFDKAGSYGIQDYWGLVVVTRIDGSYTNVMGLPTERLFETLKAFL